MFDLEAQIRIDFRDKKWNEVNELGPKFIDLIKSKIDPKYNPGTYLKIKTITGTFKVPLAKKAELDSLNQKDAFIISPFIKDYQVLLNLLNAIKKVYVDYDKELFGKVKVSLHANAFTGYVKMESNGIFTPSLTKVSKNEVSDKAKEGIEILNKDIASIDAVEEEV